MRIYRHPTQPTVQLPQLDLLTLLLDSEHSLAQDDTILHQEAANPDNKLTKAELRDLVQRIAHGLRYKYGIGAKGSNKDVVTVISYGQILVPAVYLGVVAAGGVYSAASPSSTVAELQRQVEIGNSRLLICGADHVDVASSAAQRSGLTESDVLLLDSTWQRWELQSLDGKVNAISDERLQWQTITDPKELAESLITILWSSGTTGLPKGVMLSHLNLVAEIYITSLSGRQWAERELAKGNELPIVEIRTLAHLPISHIAGLLSYIVGPIYAGGTVVWMRKYNWPDFLKNLHQYTITTLYTVPSIFLRIAKSPEVTDHFKHLIGAATGAAPMDGELQRAANAKLSSGKEAMIGQTWGLSETTGAITAMPKGQTDDTGSISPLLPSVELRIVDEEYSDVEPGQEGEMLVRSPLVTKGYYDNPQATKEAFHDGWFCTGDVGVLRDGKFYIVDRKKELLKYKGLQVAPAELENLLFTHPGIREAAIVGVPASDDPGTDLPRAYVVPVEAGVLSEKEVKAWVAERVASHKQLRGGVVFVDEIPKNAIGKLLRRDLRERAKREIGAGVKAKL
ncbi:hypothetical protein LTR85_009882 [Meristemomyces frigidus]|nr:hypothetical protein LTR85_009882 [Meristemomyces frigidus]